MIKTMLPGLFAVVAAVHAAGPAIAAEPRSDATPPYRLGVQSDAFRLSIPGAKRKEPPIPAWLADKPYAALIQTAALAAALDPALVHAVIFVESGYNPEARSVKGAVGLMQVMPDTAMRYGVPNPGKSPEVNLKAGTLYLKDLMQQFDNRLDLVLAAYNAGENAVVRHGQRIPPFAETLSYVPAVLAKYQEWREPAPQSPKRIHIEYLPGTRLDPPAADGEPRPAYSRP
jgi:soluble lytic murein transglycosylase-like protein